VGDFVQEWIENDSEDYRNFLDYQEEHQEIWSEECEL